MPDEDIEQQDSSNLSSEEDVNTTEFEEEATPAESEESLEVENAKLKETNQKLYARMKQAQGFAKNESGQWVKVSKAPSATSTKEPQQAPSDNATLNSKDLYALIEAKVPQEDIDEVVEFAKFRNISVVEALKTNVMKTLLNEKFEERRSALTASTGTTRRGTSRVSDEALLERAQRGDVPEDEESLRRLAQIRLQKRAK